MPNVFCPLSLTGERLRFCTLAQLRQQSQVRTRRAWALQAFVRSRHLREQEDVDAKCECGIIADGNGMDGKDKLVVLSMLYKGPDGLVEIVVSWLTDS